MIFKVEIPRQKMSQCQTWRQAHQDLVAIVTHQQLEAILMRTKALRRDVKAETNIRVCKSRLREEAAALGSDWHQSDAPSLKHSLSPDLMDKYGALYKRLIQLSVAGSRQAAYLETLENSLSHLTPT